MNINETDCNLDEMFSNLQPIKNHEKMVDDKSILVGDELLIPRNKWVAFDEINSTVKILSNPIFETAFAEIVKKHKPKEKVAFISLCTTTRPYQFSRKWGEFKKAFGSMADLIVLSNGGIIPEKFWQSYPYMNYDGPDVADQETFNKLTEDRLTRLFSKHKYDYILANFRPNMPNTRYIVDKALSQLKEKGKIKDYLILPTEEQYNKLQEDGFPGGKMFPDLDTDILKSFIDTITKFNTLVNPEFKVYNEKDASNSLF